MGNRRQAREAALAYLYQEDYKLHSVTEEENKFIDHFKVAESFRDYFAILIHGVKEHQTAIDQELEAAAEHWKLYRMARIDRCILRLSSWELMYEPETPTKVIIDEGVELAKIYGGQDSSAFVNGVLDRISKKFRPA